ncbi:MAG: zinc dependent phospholipase C family protein [Oscillospiraceae bacterium]|nr:zinc dependent phospholipase C family protein [Ruminococcus sp.]MCD8345573.1 zinc dependent phospholipase C family protein [Oscillospiraceae bacterium]
MPSTYAHYVLGRDLLRQYSDDLKDVLRNNLKIYQIGLHGPDILFYYKPLAKNPIRQLGGAIHDRPGAEFFGNAKKVVNSADSLEERNRRLSYALGFVGHFSLDSMCHGYVEKKLTVSGVTHSEIEVEFDRYLMLKDGLNPVTHHLTGHIHPTDENARIMALFYDDVSSREAKTAIRSFVTYNGLLVAPNDMKRLLIYSVLAASGNYRGMHGMVVNKKPNPKCEDSNLRLEKLMKKAEGLCLKLSDNFLKFANGEEELLPWFEKTFEKGDDWQSIPILTAMEERHYEV